MMRNYLKASMIPTAAMLRMAEGEPMGVIELDGNLADAEKPPELRAGVYEGELQDIQVKTSGAGNDYYNMKWVVPTDELPNDVKDDYPDGAVFFHNRIMVIDPEKPDRRRLYNLRRFIESIGLDSNTNRIDPNEWMGRRARLQIRMGKFAGEDRAEIQAILPAEARATERTTTRAPAKKAASGRRGR